MTRRLLNQYQRNPVAITLRTLETVLRETVTRLSVQEQGILYQQETTLSRKQCEQLEQLSASALGEISKLAKTLALPTEVRDKRSTLQGQLVILWSDLHEITAEKLAAYGEVAPDLKPVLNPSLRHLAELVQQMLDVVAQRDNGHDGD